MIKEEHIMASNSYDYNQVSAVLNEVVKLATGQESAVEFNGGDVVSVAQKALTVGYDNFNKALSQVIANTIFSIRPYTRKFSGLVANNVRFGQITRKIKPIQKPVQDEKSLPLTDGASVDPFKISKHGAVQLNFIGENGWEYRSEERRVGKECRVGRWWYLGNIEGDELINSYRSD